MKYFAKKDSMFGIKKGDSLTYDLVKKTLTLDRTRKVIPIDPATEPLYFEPEITLYKKDDRLILKSPTAFKPISGGGKFTIPAFEPLRVMDIKRTMVGRKDSVVYTVKMENASSTKNFHYDIVEAVLFPFEVYHFINSKGQICYSIEGKDPKADSFRTLMGNKFKTSQEAQVRLKFFTS